MQDNLTHLAEALVLVLNVSLWSDRREPGSSLHPHDTTDHFAAVLSRVASLHQIDGGDGPTEHALATAVKLLSDTHLLVDTPFPLASASTTEDGSIHVYWERPDRTLLLSAPATADEPGFIYHRSHDEYAAIREVTPQTLAGWIRWLAYE